MADDNILDAFKDDLALFVEAGFVAVKQFDEVSATRLFHAAYILDPKNPASRLGLGYIHLNKLQVNEAAKIFEEILQQNPEHNLAKALLGIAYVMTKNKRKKGEKLLEEANEKTDDPTIKNLVVVCKDWIDKDLKEKDRSPLIPASKEREEEE